MEVVLLDERIGLYVLFPIFVAVTLVAVLRQNVSASVKHPQYPDLQRIQLNSLLHRSALLRGAGSAFLPSFAVEARKEFFIGEGTGALAGMSRRLAAENNALKALESFAKLDPSQTMGLLKSQLSFIFLQGGTAYFINYLFPDFLVAKMPFPLTYRFKSMLQRGVDLPSLDVTYVSSLSWYFLIMLSNSGLLFLLSALWSADPVQQKLQPLAEGCVAEQPGVQQALMMDAGMASMLGMPGMGGPDPKKQVAQEEEAWKNATYEFALEGVERRLLAKFRAEKTRSGRCTTADA